MIGSVLRGGCALRPIRLVRAKCSPNPDRSLKAAWERLQPSSATARARLWVSSTF